MDDELRKRLLREEMMRKNNGKRSVEAKYTPKYPISAEREYKRLINGYMAVERDVLMRHIPELKRILNEGTQFNADSKRDNIKNRKTVRFINIDNTILRLRNYFEKVKNELESALGMYDLKGGLQRISRLEHKLSISEWRKVISRTLGINILDDYYSGDDYMQLLDEWISDNVDLISTIPHDSLGRMKQLVYDNYMGGETTTDIVSEIQRVYGTSKSHARMIARDQTAKLNAQITQKQQRDAGVNRYKWSTAGDERVRDSHDALDGKIFSWDDPPETDSGRRCHPGEDYQCRCCAIPVFDINELDLPV